MVLDLLELESQLIESSHVSSVAEQSPEKTAQTGFKPRESLCWSGLATLNVPDPSVVPSLAIKHKIYILG